MTPTINEAALEAKLLELESARPWSPRMISRLETTIRSADDYDLFRVNPLAYAGEKGMREDETIDLFLHATKCGLFEMDWHMVCGVCGHIVNSLQSLDQVHGHYRCDVCSVENSAALDDFIQVTFTIAPTIRAISYHEPEQLPVEDYYFRYQMSRDVKVPIEGVTYADVAKSITRLVAWLEPGEKASVEFEAANGFFYGTDLLHHASLMMLVGTQPGDAEQSIRYELNDGKLKPVNPVYPPQRVEIGGLWWACESFAQLPAGKFAFTFENRLDHRGSIWLVFYPMPSEQGPRAFHPFLSGKQLITTQTFRSLFRSEVVSASEGLAVRDLTYLFTDLKGSTELYEAIGDPNAYNLVRQHFDTLGMVISKHSGAIVKTIGDAVMATFMSPLDAMNAAHEMLHELGKFNQNISEKLVLKVGMHRGHSIAVTLNDRIDYFGQSVNIASRVQGLAGADEVCFTEAILNYPGVRETLAGHAIGEEEALLKGVSARVTVYRVS